MRGNRPDRDDIGPLSAEVIKDLQSRVGNHAVCLLLHNRNPARPITALIKAEGSALQLSAAHPVGGDAEIAPDASGNWLSHCLKRLTRLFHGSSPQVTR